MAVGIGVMEIPDSEEEPLTSSPVVVSDGAAHKLFVNARQDAQDPACRHQEPTEDTANEASGRTSRLEVDQNNASSNVETTPMDQLDVVQFAQQTTTNDCNTCISTAQVKEGIPLTHDNLDAASDQLAGCAGLERADGGRHTAQEKGIDETTVDAAQFGACKSKSSNSQNGVSDDQINKELQSGLPELVPANLDGVNIERLQTKLKHSQDEAIRSHTATLKPSPSDCAYVASEIQGHSQLSEVSPFTIARVPDVKASPEQPQRRMASELSAGQSVSTATNPPCLDTNSHYAAHYMTDIPESVDIDPIPAAVHPSISCGDAEDAVRASVSSSPCDDSSTTRHYSSQQNVESTFIVAALAPLSSAEPSVIASNNGCKGSFDAPLSSAALSSAACIDVYEQTLSTDADLGLVLQDSTLNKNETNRVPMKLSSGQSPENVDAEASTLSIAEQQPAECSAQCINETNQSTRRQIVMNRGLQSSASTVPVPHTPLQSTNLQTSEPASPSLSVKLNPQETTLAELKAQRAALLASLGALPAIQVLIEENQAYDVDVSDDDGGPTDADITAAANKIVKEHIKMLHEYNELKDVGQGLMGLIADQRGMRIVEVQNEFGIDAND